MPSDDSLLEQAEEWKRKGNEAFQKSEIEEAISAYSQGLVQVDRVTPAPVATKTALLSNRAMCYLKVMNLQPCLDDCTKALDMLQETSSEEPKLRSKLLFRRAKASFLKANMPGVTGLNDMLQEAAKDLLALLSFDPKNKEASMLLQSIRAQHAMVKKSNTPLSKTLDSVKDLEGNDKDRLYKLKVLGGLIDTDTAGASMELGRLSGVEYLLELATKEKSKATNEIRAAALNCLACAGAHPPFVRAYLKDVQEQVANIVKADDFVDVIVSGLSILVKCLLHLDRDHPDKPVVQDSDVNDGAILDACIAILDASEGKTELAIRGVMENLMLMACGNDRTMVIRAAISGDVANTGNLDGLPPPKSKAEINAMTAKELAAHRNREHELKVRDLKWSMDRVKLFLEKQGLESVLRCAAKIDDHFLRREMTAVIGKVLKALSSEDDVEAKVIKKITKPFLMNQKENIDDKEMCTIEEVYNDDEDEEKGAEEEEEEGNTLQSMMERAELTTALLLSLGDVGAWAICTAWMEAEKELAKMVDSGQDRPMAMASEVISAASTVKESRNMVTLLMDSGAMEKLLMHDDRDIRSGAAAAVAKLGLSGRDKDKADEGDVMGMLQAAADLLADDSNQLENTQAKKDAFSKLTASFGTTSLERGVEMVTYLISQTHVKEEICAGFRAEPTTKYSVLESLVKIAELPNAGESLSGFGLATIFQHMAVTPDTIKKEHFQDKELSADEYDELQKLAKTPEEKKIFEAMKSDDTEELCAARIRAMAQANVPRALVQLMTGASEQTLEQIILAFKRLANEQSVRGQMIQQGVLTACIKVDKDPNPSTLMKKIIRNARHVIAKMLITKDPRLLTSHQCMGSIKPLIQLLRDVEAKELMQFEALMALTNIAASGDDKQNRIVAEQGIPTLHYSMFSDHDLVRKAATEAMCNLAGNKAFMEHLSNPENLRLWLAFAADYDENFECARAAGGCLAMVTQDPIIASALVKLPKFQKFMDELLQCGSLELMHRTLVLMHNLVAHGGETKEAVVKCGFGAFCLSYVNSYHDDSKIEELEFSAEEKHLMPITVDLAKKIVAVCDA